MLSSVDMFSLEKLFNLLKRDIVQIVSAKPVAASGGSFLPSQITQYATSEMKKSISYFQCISIQLAILNDKI